MPARVRNAMAPMREYDDPHVVPRNKQNTWVCATFMFDVAQRNITFMFDMHVNIIKMTCFDKFV